MSEPAAAPTRATVGVRDIPLALFAPRRLFRRVEDVGAYGWPLAVLLTAVTLLGWAVVETGLIDREVDRTVDRRINETVKISKDTIDRAELRKIVQAELDAGNFQKLITRIRVIVAEPVKVLAAILLIGATCYGLVALTGRKPEWHTLLTVCVYASYVTLLGLAVQLAFMLRFATLEVETSAAVFARYLVDQPGMTPRNLAIVAGLLSAIDPFRIWYWLVVVTGVSTTGQLRGWQAWLLGTLGWLLGAAGRVGVNLAIVSMAQSQAGGG